MQEQPNLPLPDLPGVGDGWELLLPQDERARRCTGQSAVKTEELRQAIVQACVQLGTRQVAAAFKVSREVVRALRAESIRCGELDHLRKEAGVKALAVADKIVDRIDDEIDDMPKTALAYAYKVLSDSGRLDTGQPTARIEHTVTATHEDINDWVNSLPSAEPVHSPENSPYKDLPALDAGGQTIDLGPDNTGTADPQSPPSGDSKSLVSESITYDVPKQRADSGRIDDQKEAGS